MSSIVIYYRFQSITIEWYRLYRLISDIDFLSIDYAWLYRILWFKFKQWDPFFYFRNTKCCNWLLYTSSVSSKHYLSQTRSTRLYDDCLVNVIVNFSLAWELLELSMLCSDHTVSGKKSQSKTIILTVHVNPRKTVKAIHTNPKEYKNR